MVDATNVARDYQRITILILPPAKQNFPSLLSSIPSLFLPLFLRFSQFFLATFTPRFARLWHRVRWIFLDSQRESTATTIRLVTRPVPSFLTPARVHAGKYAGRPCTLIHSRPFYRPMGSIGIWSEYTQMAFFLSFYFFIFFSFFLSYGALMKSWKEGGDFWGNFNRVAKSGGAINKHARLSQQRGGIGGEERESRHVIFPTIRGFLRVPLC